MADQSDGFTFTWKIENFSMLPYRNGDYLKCLSFEVDTYKNIQFQLKLYPKGIEGQEGHAACFLQKTESNCDLKIKFYFALQSTKTTDAVVSRTLVYPAGSSELGIDNFFQLNEIFAKKHLYLPNDTLTLHCHFLPTNEDSSESTEHELETQRYSTRTSCVCRSCIPVWRRTVMWSIPNIHSIGGIVEKVINSAFLSSPSFKLSIKFDTFSIDEFLPIEIRLVDELLEDEIFVECKLTVISPYKEHQDCQENTYFFVEKSDVWQFPPFIKASNLKSDKYLFLDGTLHLQCEFVFPEGDGEYHLEDICMPPTPGARQNHHVYELRTSIENCYSNGKFCDTQLIAGDQIFPAHRLVLGARSSVFCAMFENDFKEKNSGIVDINDVDPTTLNSMLSFLYDDVLKEDLSPKDAWKLYEAADKYDIPSLKQHCWVSLIASLSVVSVCDVLVIADTHNDSFLLTAVYNFISVNADEIFHSSYWKSLMDDNLQLAAKVMHKMLTEKNVI